jgi:hypothetical protein
LAHFFAKPDPHIITRRTTLTMTSNVGKDNAIDDCLPEQDRVLFGTRTFNVSDELTDSIDAALMEGVASLPRLPNDEALLELLRKVYFRNANVLEAYLGRNVFSIQSLPPSRRKRIVEAFLTKEDPAMPSGVALQDLTNQARPVSYPTADQIPSVTDMERVNQELTDLRSKHTQVKRRRNQLVTHLQKLAKAHESVVSAALLDPKQSRTISESIQNMIIGKQALDEATFRGKALTERLDESKRQYSPERGVLETKKPKLGLEQAFEEDSKVGGIEGLRKVQQALARDVLREQ